jgi:hypothetical protein
VGELSLPTLDVDLQTNSTSFKELIKRSLHAADQVSERRRVPAWTKFNI